MTGHIIRGRKGQMGDVGYPGEIYCVYNSYENNDIF